MSNSEPVTVLNPFERVRALSAAMQREMGSRIVGQDDIVNSLVGALLIGGHVLLEPVHLVERSWQRLLHGDELWSQPIER